MTLEPLFFRDAVSCLLFDMKRPDLARKLAGSDFSRLAQLADLCADNPEYADLAQELRSDANAALRLRAATADAAATELATLASLELQRGESSAAVGLYRRALAKDYKQVEWHFALAGALAAQGKVKDAEHEAKICLRLRPEHPGARRLLEELIKNPVAR